MIMCSLETHRHLKIEKRKWALALRIMWCKRSIAKAHLKVAVRRKVRVAVKKRMNKY